MVGPADDPLDFAKKLAESYRGIKFGRGVVGKNAYLTGVVLGLWGLIIYRLSGNGFLDATLIGGGIVVTLIYLWWVNKSHKFAEKNPGQAILDGAQFIEYQKWEAEIKGLPPPKPPLIPKPGDN